MNTEKLESLITELRKVSKEIGALVTKSSDDEDNLDGATGAIQDAVEELEEILSRH